MKNRTNSKVVKEAIKQLILDSVYDDSENEYKTFGDAAKRLNDEFKRVANNKFNIHNIPNNAQRFTDYLQGLPFRFASSYYEAETFLNSLGINPENKKYESDKIWNLYGLLIYREIQKY